MSKDEQQIKENFAGSEEKEVNFWCVNVRMFLTSLCAKPLKITDEMKT
jgi:hypothetical protein